MNPNRPNFKKIYSDLLTLKYPHKKKYCQTLLNKETLTDYDLMVLNKIIFGDKQHNQRLRSYDKETILKILDYQKKNHLNNTELGSHFKISRNTIAKWKKEFMV